MSVIRQYKWQTTKWTNSRSQSNKSIKQYLLSNLFLYRTLKGMFHSVGILIKDARLQVDCTLWVRNSDVSDPCWSERARANQFFARGSTMKYDSIHLKRIGNNGKHYWLRMVALSQKDKEIQIITSIRSRVHWKNSLPSLPRNALTHLL